VSFKTRANNPNVYFSSDKLDFNFFLSPVLVISFSPEAPGIKSGLLAGNCESAHSSPQACNAQLEDWIVQ
jgi:hypothetical protein